MCRASAWARYFVVVKTTHMLIVVAWARKLIVVAWARKLMVVALLSCLAATAGAQTSGDPVNTGDLGNTDAQEQVRTPAGMPTPADVGVADLIGPPAPGPEDLSPHDAEMVAWGSLAVRVETAITDGVSSEFALTRLRAAVYDWRERFLIEQGEGAARIATVSAQLQALGTVSEGDPTEEPRIAYRREELTAQQRKLRAPQRLAQEAYAHADGLISELDAVLRVQRTRALAVRGVSPLDLNIWPGALRDISARFQALTVEVRTSFGSAARRETFNAQLPVVALLLLIAALLLQRGRYTRNWILARMHHASWRGAGVWRLVALFGQVALPLIGLLALQSALLRSGLFGYRVGLIVESVVPAGSSIVVARWLAAQFFAPERTELSSMDIAPEVRANIRRLLELLGWIIAAWTMLEAVLAGAEMSEPALVVARFPLQVALALVLFRLGQLFSRTRAKTTGDAARARRSVVLPLFGRALTVVAVLGPLLTGLGYARAYDALIGPAVLTLALMGIVILLQRLAYEIYGLVSGDTRRGEDALVPVLIGFALVLLAVPPLAMIWGVRIEEMAEIWARFREGYSLGETRLSPTDLVTFAVVFGVGYGLTRLVQGTLRISILPRTRLDTGARNAIVAGIGYVGIFVATIAAITAAGIDLSSLAIVAGALSLGIGFGLQNIVSNFVSGIILLIERPISEGDWIEVGTQMGYVRAISVRSTRIETFDRTDVIIPNADLVTGTVTNWTRNNSVGRVLVPIGVAYGNDTKRVAEILQEIAEANPMVLLEPPPTVLFLGFGADAMNFEIRAILRDVNFIMVVTSEMNHQIATRFAAEGIEIPFAQRDVWLRNPEVLQSVFRADAAGAALVPVAGAVDGYGNDVDDDDDDDNAVHKAAKWAD